ncbi:glycosyltransferase [Holdemanella porci]|uniref:glycosyltransferase n=1 Tax=Holdemanella porci TaxID=2652276 RepID=UPI003F917D02
MKIAYLILHYMAGADTIECIDSILKTTEYSKYETNIIVVDNGSTNDSFQQISNKFKDNKKIKLIHSDINLGFAKGNNLGYRYAKYELNADFIVQLNNDTIISQIDFNEVLVNKFYEKRYAVLGPDIVTADGYHQNPGKKQCWSKSELSIYRIKKRIRLYLSYLYLDEYISSFINNVKVIYSTTTINGDIENTILHGACLIFSPLFINRFDGLYDKTFLYWEEDILKLQSDYLKFKMLYTSDLQIYHKEDVATNMIAINNRDKNIKKYRLLIESSKVYSNLLKCYNSK